MINVDFKLKLEHLRVARKNEGSADEPFLWVVGLKFDGVTSQHLFLDGTTPDAMLDRAMRAELAFFTPPGRHGNLGQASDDMDLQETVNIPKALGVWETRLQMDVPEIVDPSNPVFKDPPELAAFATVAMFVVALEEDGTKDSHAIEVHRRLIERVKARATLVLRQVLADAINALVGNDGTPPSAEDVRDRLQRRLSPRAIRQIIDRFKDDVMPGAIVGAIVNPFTLPAAISQSDTDDFVGWGSVDYSMPRIIAHAVDGFEISLALNKDRSMAGILEDLGAELTDEARERLEQMLARSEDGNYVVTGRAYRTDLREPPTLGAVWQPSRALVIGRGNDRAAFGAAMEDDGDRHRWRALGQGVFTSGVSATSSLDGQKLFVVGRGTDNRIWLGEADDLGGLATMGWRPTEAMPSRYGAGVAFAGQAKRLHVFAIDDDHRVRWSWSKDEGVSWTLPWGYCGQALLDATPAAVITNRGEHLNVFGLGRDRHVWRAYSPDGGVHWSHLWSQSGIPSDVFDSAPAACMSIGGRRLLLCAKNNGRLFVLRSDDFGQTWSKDGWRRLGVPDLGDEMEGSFISAPAVCASPDLKEVYIFAVANNLHMYWRRVVDDEWSPWRQMGDRLFA